MRITSLLIDLCESIIFYHIFLKNSRAFEGMMKIQKMRVTKVLLSDRSAKNIIIAKSICRMIPCLGHGITDDVSLLDLCDSTVLSVKAGIYRIEVL
jgi:hypothetical protein